MISVVIPVFNREKFIAKAIDSVLSQTLSADEIIVVDDGSSDGTHAILQSYHDKIQVISQKNAGVSAARNRGIKASRGRWIALLDSDDRWQVDKLYLQRSYHDNNPACLISHTDEKWLRNNKEVKQKKRHAKPHGWCFEENMDFCKIAPSSVMIERSVFEKIGYFDETLPVCEDYDLWLRILREYELGLINQALTTKYAGHGDQLSFSTPLMDRFRISALLKHIDNAAAVRMLERKIAIMIAGAKKHQNSELLHYYTQLQNSLDISPGLT